MIIIIKVSEMRDQYKIMWINEREVVNNEWNSSKQNINKLNGIIKYHPECLTRCIYSANVSAYIYHFYRPLINYCINHSGVLKSLENIDY